MITVSQPGDLRKQVGGWRQAGDSIGFVPTMGALHGGHLALVERSSQLCDRTVVSVFVNPTQFGPNDDFETYPRDAESDAALLEEKGCDLLFLPEVETIYPPGHTTFVEVGIQAKGLEGDERPGHFRGVATVVTQLFNLVQPDLAVFGEKDAQQLAVIQQLVRDLHLPIEIVRHPIVREDDGLAMSSRNAYLSTEQRRAATALHRALGEARKHFSEGERSAYRLKQAMRSTLGLEPDLQIDYAEVVDPQSFQPLSEVNGRAVLPIAVKLGNTRLIDSLELDQNTLPIKGTRYSIPNN